jgi:proton-translocating NAD(P)+ transhydrogenase subunit alpha
MRIAVPREIVPHEARVALVPETVGKLVKSGLEVAVETNAGAQAMFLDDAYRQAGATVVADLPALYESADVVLKVREPVMSDSLGVHEAERVREGGTLIAFLGRDAQSDAARRLAARGVVAFSMEMIPRISRAQKMDALSSMSTVAGYKAVLLGAGALGKFFPLLMTAAGTIAPARVFVLGAGVAGLQAIATARRLGAVVEAFDVRPAVRDEVQSLGATFVGHELLDEAAVAAGGYAKEMTPEQQAKQRQLVAERLKQSDVVISTAMVPGRKAPILIPEETVRGMRPGSVIVDLAAEMGGNCELTQPGTDVVRHAVTILGPLNLAATLPVHASQMYARNVLALLTHLLKDGRLHLDFEDEITRETCLVRPPAGANADAAAAPTMAARRAS